MPIDVKKGLKKVVDSFKKSRPTIPENLKRMQQTQERATQTAQQIKKERLS